MKRTALITISLLLISLPFFAETGVLTNIEGKVEVMREGSSSWEPASENTEVNLNDSVATSFNSSANLVMGDNAVLLKPLSRMTIDTLIQGTEETKTSLFLQVGACRASVDSSKSIKQDFKIVTPHSTASVRGTIFELTPTRLTVLQGAVAFYPGLSKRDKQTGGTEDKDEDEEEVEAIVVNQGESAVMTLGVGGSGGQEVSVEETEEQDIRVQTVPAGEDKPSGETENTNEQDETEGGFKLNWVWGE